MYAKLLKQPLQSLPFAFRSGTGINGKVVNVHGAKMLVEGLPFEDACGPPADDFASGKLDHDPIAMADDTLPPLARLQLNIYPVATSSMLSPRRVRQDATHPLPRFATSHRAS